MEFVADGFLVCRSQYDRRDGDKLIPQYKYHFLVGDLENGMLNVPLLQSFTADHEILTGKERFMDKVKVRVRISTSFEKDGAGRYIQVQRPVYALVDLTK